MDFLLLQLCLQRKFPSIKDFKAIAIYQNQICYELDQQQCIGNLNEVNCAISALSRCKCGPESVDSCPVKSIYAAPNFVEVREFEDIVMIATKVKAYTVINDKSKTTHLTPSSGIFSLNLHQKEILQIGHVKIHGISKNVTHISHVSFESFTLPPEPSWVTVTFKESIVDKVDEFFIEIVVSLSVLLIITVLAFVTFCYCHFSK